jgi:hypothetical protein
MGDLPACPKSEASGDSVAATSVSTGQARTLAASLAEPEERPQPGVLRGGTAREHLAELESQLCAEFMLRGVDLVVPTTVTWGRTPRSRSTWVDERGAGKLLRTGSAYAPLYKALYEMLGLKRFLTFDAGGCQRALCSAIFSTRILCRRSQGPSYTSSPFLQVATRQSI